MKAVCRLLAVLPVITTVAGLTTSVPSLYAQNGMNHPNWGHWSGAWRPTQPALPTPVPTPEPKQSAEVLGEPQPAGDWQLTYELWQWGISYLSDLAPVAPIHGRADVLIHGDEIKRWAPDDLELLVAASIAHQASDFKDRPFGTDALEAIWREVVDDNISVGIAQLRSEEVIFWAPHLRGLDLLSPEVAIRVMTAKLSQASRIILAYQPNVSDTDRYMLLALVQNAASYTTMRNTISYFFNVAGADWGAMLQGERAEEQDWREQLRLVLVHLVWLTEEGWPVPPNLDVDYWSQVAFSEP